MLFRSKDVEKAGSSFKRVYELCKKDNIECFYETNKYGFEFGFLRKNVTLNVTVDDTLKSNMTENEKIIYKAICQNIKITRADLSIILDKSERTIQRILNSLVSKGYLIRIGDNRFGYWEILK